MDNLLRRFSAATTSPPPRQSSTDSTGKPRASSFSNFDMDQTIMVSPSQIDPATMFEGLDPTTPAGEALAANQNFKQTRLDKLGNKVVKKRLKLKNFTKDVKRSRRRRRSHIKGKKIDGKHEQYALSIGMMLGIRCCVGKVEQITSQSIAPPDTHVSTITSLTSMQSLTSLTSSNTTNPTRPTNPNKLRFEDFMQVDKYVFPPGGNTTGPHITPPHQLAHTFKFKAYAPAVFAKIRTMFGVEPAHFMLSICGNYNFIEFISNAKSGQFFFYSHDGRYMIKTQTDAESKFLRRIMPHFYQHLVKNPNSTLTQFYGMYRVKMNHLRRNVHFVVMKSVFNTDKRIDKVWDLKGSLVGRSAKPGESVFKDKDLLDSNFKVMMGPEKKKLFMDQLQKDVMFLAKLDIMDYSLLLGMHDRRKATDTASKGKGEVSRSDTPMRRNRREEVNKDGEGGAEEADEGIGRRLGNVPEEPDDAGALDTSDTDNADNTEGDDNSEDESEYGGNNSDDETDTRSESQESLQDNMHVLSVMEREAVENMVNGVHKTPNPWTTRLDGGVDGIFACGGKSDEIYFSGIIDILQQYNSRKRAETFFKGLMFDTKQISCVDPKWYSERFIQYMDKMIE